MSAGEGDYYFAFIDLHTGNQMRARHVVFLRAKTDHHSNNRRGWLVRADVKVCANWQQEQQRQGQPKRPQMLGHPKLQKSESRWASQVKSSTLSAHTSRLEPNRHSIAHEKGRGPEPAPSQALEPVGLSAC